MDENRLLERIRSAYSHAAPDCLDEILASCEDMKGTVINMNERKKNRFVPIAIAAALVLAIIGGFVGYSLGGGGKPSDLPAVTSDAPQTLLSSVITLDVNPSIEIDVDSSDTVTAVKALNEDARIVIGSMDFAGSSLEVTVNALIGSMLQNGYLDEIRNSILVSVSGGDASRAAALQQTVSGMIESALGTGGIDGAVISQTLTADSSVTSLAADYNITEGKAALISKLVAADPTLTVEGLVTLPINDIALIASSRGITDNSVTSTGSASEGAYIGSQAALEAACAHAGIDSASLAGSHVSFDSENGRLVYEVDMYTAGAEYEYDIDALTGDVVKYERETYPTSVTVPSSAPQSGSYIGEAAAKQAAVSHSGVNSANVVWLKAQFERDDGRYVYELEFTCTGAKYDYTVDALTGDVVKYEREQFNGGNAQGNGNGWQGGQNASGNLIGESAAKSAAFSHAGVSESDASRVKVELDRDDGYTLYEVEFRVGFMEYEYKIDAYSGAVLKAESDYDD